MSMSPAQWPRLTAGLARAGSDFRMDREISDQHFPAVPRCESPGLVSENIPPNKSVIAKTYPCQGTHKSSRSCRATCDTLTFAGVAAEARDGERLVT